MLESEIGQAIRNRAPIIHAATVNCGEIEYECILSTYPMKNGLGVILKSRTGRGITYALPKNIRLKEGK